MNRLQLNFIGERIRKSPLPSKYKQIHYREAVVYGWNG